MKKSTMVKIKKKQTTKPKKRKGTAGKGFKKGDDPGRNPRGRPVGSTNKYSIVELMSAIGSVESKQGRDKLLVSFVKQAYDNPQIMIALMKKVLPDLRSIEAVLSTFESSMSDELAVSIQNELLGRYSVDKPSGSKDL